MDHSLTLCFLFFVWISHVTAQGVSIEGCPILPVRLSVPNQDDLIIGTWTEPTANAERIFRSHIPGQAILPIGFHEIIYEFRNTATGEEGICTFLYIVFWSEDEQPPQIQNCPGDIVRTISVGASTLTVSWNVPTAIDNAGPLMSTSSHEPPFDFPVGVHTVRYTFEDTRSLISICEFNVMVTGIDMEAPVIICPENQLENAVAGAATWFVSWPAVTATDDSLQTPQLISSSPSSLQGITGGTFNVGRVTTVRYDYADGSGNEASCIFDVTVNAFVDMDPPMIRCSNNDVRRVASGSDAVVVWTVPTIEFDASLPVQIVSNFESGETFPIGTELVEYTFTDAVGNVAVCSFNVIVEDITPPVFQNCPQVDIMDTLTVTETSKRIEWQTIVAVDNSNGMTFITGSHQSGQFFPEGPTEVRLTARDESNNMANCQFRVVLTQDTENEPPEVMDCPMPIIEIAPGDQSGSTVSWEEPRAQDDDGIPTRRRTHVPPELFQIGITEVEYTFTDIGGLVSSCRFTVTILDRTPPQIFGCPQVPIRTTLSPGGSETPVSFTPPTATDNSLGIVTTSSTHNPGETFPLGTTLVTYQFRDESGNIDQCEFAVIVSDSPDLTRPEIFNCPDDISQQASGTGQELVRWPPITATDDSGVPPMLVLGPPNFQDFFTPGMSEVVTYLFQDAAGNANTCTFTVTVVNRPTLPPVVDCRGLDRVATAMFGASSVFVTLPTCSATDDSGQAIFVSQTPPSGFFGLGSTTVTNIFADPDGNQGFGTFTVTVNPEADNEPPVVDCSGRTVRRNAPAGSSGIQVILPSCTATDNSGTANEVSQSPTSGSFFPIGTTQVTNTFVDPSGNRGVGTFEVIISVSSPPVVDCSGLDIVLTVPLVTTGSTATYAPCPATDDSGLPTFSSQSPPSGSFFRLGTTIVETCFVDPDGNRGCDSFTVTVNAADNEPPVVDCSGRTVRRNAPAGSSGVQVVLPSCTATDNSGTANEVSQSPTSSSFFLVGTTQVTNTFVDPSGNRGVGTFEVIISGDNEPPVVDCSGRTIRRNAPPGSSGIQVVLPSCTATDNSGTANEVSQSPTSDSFFPIGTTRVTNTFVDPSGNQGVGTFEVIISGDNEPPVVDCSGITVNRNAPPGASGVQVVLPSCTATDNSGTVFEVSQSPPSGSVFPVGTTVVTNIFRDANGNQGQDTFVVFVRVDNEPPVVNCDGLSFSRTVPAGTQSLVVNLPVCTATDNSGTVLPLPQNPRPGTPFPVGATVVENTFEDPSSNRATGFYTVTIIEDRPRLQINCPTNAVAQCQTNSNAIIGLWSAPDCTGGVQPITTSCSPSSGSDISSGQQFATCTCEDNVGETETCFFNLPAAENIPPTVDCSGLDITRMAPSGASGVTVLLPSCRASDNSGTVLPMNQSPSSGSFFTIGLTIVRNTFEDACGNTATDTFIVTVNPGVENLVINCPTNAVAQCQTNSDAIIGLWSDPDCTGGVQPRTTSCSPSSGSDISSGQQFATCTCEDNVGETETCFFNLPAAENIPPTVDCSGLDITRMAPSGASGVTVLLPSCRASDNSGTVLPMNQSPSSGSFFTIGSTIVRNTFEDACGNTATDTFIVTVNPEIRLVDITCPSDGTGGNEVAPGIFFATWSNPICTGSSGTLSTSCDPASGSPVGLGTTVVRCSCTDVRGQSDECTFSIFNADVMPPSVDCSGRDEVVMVLPPARGATVILPSCEVSDNSGSSLLVRQSPTSGFFFPIGTTTVTNEYADDSGNRGSDVFTVTVIAVDIEGPDVTCVDILRTVPFGQSGAIVQLNTCTAVDNSGRPPSLLSYQPTSGSFFPIGSTEVRVIFLDDAGNSGTDIFNVIVRGIDGIDPSVNCAGRDINADTTGSCAVVSFAPCTATDNSGVPPVLDSQSHQSGGCFPVGTTAVFFTFRDGAGNTGSSSFDIVVTRDTAPVLLRCPDDITDQVLITMGGGIVEYDAPIAFDESGSVQIINDIIFVPGSFFPLGTTPVTYVFSDPSGNTVDCSFSVTLVGVNPCSSRICQNGGVCQAMSLTDAACVCSGCFTGFTCQISTGACNLNSCSNGGVCIPFADSCTASYCDCPRCFSGLNCQTRVSACRNHECQNGASCIPDPVECDQYTCECLNCFRGEFCEIAIPDPCSNTPCLNGGQCIGRPDSCYGFFCACQTGFSGERCESFANILENPCNNFPCENDGSCVSSGSVYKCLCRDGYTGINCRQQTGSNSFFDQCASSPCANGGSCFNSYSTSSGSLTYTPQYTCVCPNSYTGERCTVLTSLVPQLNRCQSSNICQNGGTCLNSYCSFDDRVDFFCDCPIGFIGEVCTIPYGNPCSTSPCSNGGICIPFNQYFVCECRPGFSGSTCGLLVDVIPPTISGCPQQTIVVQASPGASSAQVNWPTPQVSDNLGGPVRLVSVNAASGGFYAVGTNQEVEYVYEDVSGNRNSCSFFIIVTQGTSTGCQLNPCLNGGTCRQVAGVDSCICPPGFTGQTCSQRTNPCSSTPCQNGGTCVQISVTGFLCQCPNQFEGDRCQTNNPCASQPCENGGTCFLIGASSILCICTGQFEGDRCQNALDICSSDPCQNGGTCVRAAVDGFVCICPPTFDGQLCERNGNPCNSFPCLNGGTCIPSANAPDFFCICQANLQGPLCQQALLDTTAPNIAGCPGNMTVTSFTSTYEQVSWQVPTATDASPPVTRTETHFPGVFIRRGQTINVIYRFTDAFTNTAVCSFFIVAPA